MKVLIKSLQYMVSISLTLACASNVLAAKYDEAMPAEPARLTDKRSSLQNSINFPRHEGDILIVMLCDAQVTDNGNLGQADCKVTNEVEDKFESEVRDGANRGRITPAKLEGRKASVYINFAVRFTKRGEQETVEVFLHHFRNQSNYGEDYLAPQRFVSKPIESCTTIYQPLSIQANVLTTGSPVGVAVTDAGYVMSFTGQEREAQSAEDRQLCVDSYSALIRDSLYVPAIFQEKYVNAVHVETFYNAIRMK